MGGTNDYGIAFRLTSRWETRVICHDLSLAQTPKYLVCSFYTVTKSNIRM